MPHTWLYIIIYSLFLSALKNDIVTQIFFDHFFVDYEKMKKFFNINNINMINANDNKIITELSLKRLLMEVMLK